METAELPCLSAWRLFDKKCAIDFLPKICASGVAGGFYKKNNDLKV